MPGRIKPLVTGEIYHVFNRGVNRQPAFTDKREYKRAQQTINFYRFLKPPVPLSKYLKMEQAKQDEVLQTLADSKKLVEIFCYCLMPNHFHFLLKQLVDQGISKFISNLQNSYTKYFNTKHERDGSLFGDQFKTVRVETDEQLVHLSRYIHLNPYAGYIIRSIEQLEGYNWSSFPNYLQDSSSFADCQFILGYFKSKQQYIKFVFDQADYQRRLKEIEYLLIDN